jgi:hypothetical protein
VLAAAAARGYREYLKSDIADINNRTPTALPARSVAALFLDRFVPEVTDWAHFDTFAWRPAAKPGRPKGGDALGLRAAWHMLKAALWKLAYERPPLSAPLFRFSGNPGLPCDDSPSERQPAGHGLRADRPGATAEAATCRCAAISRISGSRDAISCRIMPCRCRASVTAPGGAAQDRQRSRQPDTSAEELTAGTTVQRARHGRRLGLGPGRRGRLRRLPAADWRWKHDRTGSSSTARPAPPGWKSSSGWLGAPNSNC